MKPKIKQVVANILASKNRAIACERASCFAASNIALIKYWGKRNATLHLPHNSSLSISLGKLGATTTCLPCQGPITQITYNKSIVSTESDLYLGITQYLHSLGIPKNQLDINTEMNIPMAAGLASSACGYAALIQALDQLYQWQLNRPALSILARLGSGSACRSIESGFVEWHKGVDPMGMDSYGIALPQSWPELCIGIILLSTHKKAISSRIAMQRTVNESDTYKDWVIQSEEDLKQIKQAINKQDFQCFGRIAENNAESMHASMQSAHPSIDYANTKTRQAIYKIKQMRDQGTQCYYTQDAGPNIKALFLKKDYLSIKNQFPEIIIIQPFE